MMQICGFYQLSVLHPSEWQCKSCTVVNQGSSILCEVCERPRLATRPPVATAASSQGSLSELGTKVCAAAVDKAFLSL